MQASFGIYSNGQLIISDVPFDFDALKGFLDLNFDGLFWLDEDDCIEGFLWGEKRFWIQMIERSVETNIPKKENIGRPKNTGIIDRILVTMTKGIKDKIINDEMSARQVSEYYKISFPSGQKLIQRVKNGN